MPLHPAWLSLVLVAGCIACSPPSAPGADDLHVGPGRTYATPDRVPWDALEAGDRVLIDWRPEPYRAKFVLCCRGTAAAPITVCGVPGPNGELPVLDAQNALAPVSIEYTSGERGVIKIGGADFAPELVPGHIEIENLEIRNPWGATRAILRQPARHSAVLRLRFRHLRREG
jgi:hypothetical protein